MDGKPRGTVKRLKLELIKSVAFSPFWSGFGYCSTCGRWIPLSEAPLGGREPLCPYCRRPLRRKPRNNRSRKKPLWSGDWLPGCFSFYGSPVEPWNCETCPLVTECKGGMP